MALTKPKNQIIVDFLNYMKKHGGPFSAWYVGISKDAEKRLFDDHKVKEIGDQWIYDYATSSEEAREIELYFLDQGTAGGTGGGDDTAKMVYAYKMKPHTEP